MMRYKFIILVILATSFFYNCEDPPETHGTDMVLYPFSAVGLVRDNPTDTLDVWYANATAQKGVNEVVHKVITKDTVVGMNNTWFTYEYGRYHTRLGQMFNNDYSEKSSRYFKICNRGKGDVFYFIVPPPDLPKLVYQEVDYKRAIRYQDKTIYDMLFKDGKYIGANLKEIVDLYKKHDVDNQTLFLVKTDKATQQKKELSLRGNDSMFQGDEKKTMQAYYGPVSFNKCLSTSQEWGKGNVSIIFFYHQDE